VLIGRLIDRPIRPLWPKGYRQEVQGVATVLSMDPTFRPDAIAMIAMSTAFMLTGAPFDGPVAGVRVGMVDGKFKAFPTPEALQEGKLDLFVAGTKDGIMMVEAGADEVTEEEVAEAMEFAHAAFQPAVALQKQLVDKVGVTALPYELVLPDEKIQKKVDTWVEGKLGPKVRAPYPERNELINDLRVAFHDTFQLEHGEAYEALKPEYDEAFTMALHKDVRKGIVEDNERPD